MTAVYDEIEIEDMTFDEALQIYTYPCPCGDRFEVLLDDLRHGDDIAQCPSCSLQIRVVFELVCVVTVVGVVSVVWFLLLSSLQWSPSFCFLLGYHRPSSVSP